MNLRGVQAIYRFELSRFWRTLAQSLATPVISTSLYFIVFGGAIGGRMAPIDGVPYAAFIVPGLLMLTVLSESIGNASFGIYLPKFTGTIGEILSAPLSPAEMVLAYVGAAATKSLIVAALILVTARLFVPYGIAHPFAAAGFIVLTCVTFALFGFILGLWADGFEQLQIVPLLVVSPLAFLGGSFYAIGMLPEPWRTVALFNPVVYLISGLRWAFYDLPDVQVGTSLGAIALFLALCVGAVAWIFRTGWRLKA